MKKKITFTEFLHTHINMYIVTIFVYSNSSYNYALCHGFVQSLNYIHLKLNVTVCVKVPRDSFETIT